MLSRLILAVALLFVACNASIHWIETVRTATLTGPQVIPTAGSPTGYGTAVCNYDRNAVPPVFDCQVNHNVIDPTYAAIYLGNSATVSNTLLLEFTVPLSPTFRQVFTISDAGSQASYEEAFLNGFFYITIFTNVYPAGEIRGQFLASDKFYARMGPEETIPRATGTNSRGLAVGTYSFYNPRRLMSINLQHNVLNPTAVEIRVAQAGRVGPLVTRLRNAVAPVIDSYQLTVGEEIEFFDDDFYIQVLSKANPNGEIRGQFAPMDSGPDAAFTTRLNGQNQNPPTLSSAVGCGLFTYDCQTRLFEYLIIHNVPAATSAIVEQAINGSTGTTLFGLSRAQSPIFGFRYLSLEEEFLLYSLQLYVNIISINNPQGDIRGNINVENQYFTYLSGSQINPPITTGSIGCATYFFTNNRTMNYDIQHTVPFPIATDFIIGATGQNGRFAFSFPNTVSPIQGTVDLDDDELANLVDGLVYINVRSTANFNGEIRGQIFRVNPCTVTRDNGISAPAPPQPFITNPNFNINSGSSVSASLLVVFIAFAFAFLW